MSAPIPSTLQAITADWLTASLQGAGVLAHGNTVSRFETQPVPEQGAMSVVARLALEYAAPAGAGPASLVVKLPVADGSARAFTRRTGAGQREAGFYRLTDGERLHVAPKCYAAELDESGDFALILEDLTAWRTGSLLEPDPLDTEMLLDGMAELHARYWADPTLEAATWLPGGSGAGLSAGLRRSFKRCVEMFSEHMGRNTITLAELGAADSRVMDLLFQGPQTLVHGDLHLQNAMFRGGEVRAIDWQICARATPMTDISRLLSSSLDTAQRGERTAGLLQRYCDRLAAAGVRDYGFDRAVEEFAIALSYNVAVYVIAMPNANLEAYRPQEEETGVTLLDATFGRLEAALADHDTLGAVRRRLAAMPAAEG